MLKTSEGLRKQAQYDDCTDIVLDDSESDGESALREVKERERPKAARRGPGNTSVQHFRNPIATVDKSGQKRWEFRCRFCTWYVNYAT